eukprot:CAMPEP_0116022294 /NCGR_PEP_ID=MMETSP0321-20121206/10902_1 /TAXON_ID=163516 /ORGANISM="Leptocylindrus danicus var. danicus, Strain B650" /LENGTH=610 /DNA_ID=CAMNT_0003493339 /DNA_START=1135 /DNA_END=2967 /DNA_ORIENTATION=-
MNTLARSTDDQRLALEELKNRGKSNCQELESALADAIDRRCLMHQRPLYNFKKSSDIDIQNLNQSADVHFLLTSPIGSDHDRLERDSGAPLPYVSPEQSATSRHPKHTSNAAFSEQRMRKMAETARNEADVNVKASIVMMLLQKGGQLGNILAAPLVNKEVKSAMREIECKKRKRKAKDFNKRRKDLEKTRLENIMNKSTELRKVRLKEMALKERNRYRTDQCLLLLASLGSRMQHMSSALKRHRFTTQRDRRQNQASHQITAHLRLYIRRKRRRQIQWATHTLCTRFVQKIQRWRELRRNDSCDVIIDFLHGLKDLNKFHGCLTLLNRGKQWKIYKRKVILAQQHWRKKYRFITAQTKLIDNQWTNEYERITMIEVDQLHSEAMDNVSRENALIEAANRTRRALKMRSLPKIKLDSREQIRRKLISESNRKNNVLSENRMVPTEIRVKFIRSYLKALKQLYMDDMHKYIERSRAYENEVLLSQKREAFMHRYGGNMKRKVELSGAIKVKERKRNTSIRMRKQSAQLKAYDSNLDKWVPPPKPRLHVMMRQETLEKTMQLGQEFINQVAFMWQPNIRLCEISSATASICLPSFESIGCIIARTQYESFYD